MTVLLGPRWPVLRARFALARARLRYAARHFDRDARYRAYVDLWRWTAGLARARGSAESVRSPVPSTGAPAATLHRHRSFGFHAVERLGPRAFRWSRPVAGVWLDLLPGRYRVTLDTEPLRPPGSLAVYWDCRRVPTIQRLEREIRFDLVAEPAEHAGPRTLVVVVAPVPARILRPAERRRLGLPIFGLRLVPVAEDRGAGGGPDGEVPAVPEGRAKATDNRR